MVITSNAVERCYSESDALKTGLLHVLINDAYFGETVEVPGAYQKWSMSGILGGMYIVEGHVFTYTSPLMKKFIDEHNIEDGAEQTGRSLEERVLRQVFSMNPGRNFAT